MTSFMNTINSSARSRATASFQPTKRQKGTNSWQLKQFAEATLGSGSLRKVVQLPEGEDRDEWLAVNVVDFYNQINLLYGAITEFCSPQSCPEMKATDEFEYLWHDPPAFPKPTRLPAPTYISHLLTWTSNHLSNPSVFPTHPGVVFPSNFQQTIRTIFKRLYRIYAHIYCHHYGVVRGLGLEAHLNTGFKHYVLFVEEFNLADEKGNKKGEWYGPLGELVESMLRSD
ncbi:putative maintenance of ploidy protein mob1 [Fulvia fulva]|uniref:Maintenance of ploidy protein mob1 n=1 Tax=Passalora fulva TaxID=5499 RepID=A0A9Q8P367_PASFU|nr:putative maintenance of ploidy protein mob1 [Fulvia fulva]KAK4636103.1 putative maintenance of ploidy protein mob1 [Fulvia fulva]KAK4637164.1 putative maintenance of ploidy protein mob1 [Fulvia fulva]UJO11685.1 putative maintenance of ploidy protein mob1 [Fulvia fulva]WPV10046.1 putative maintenance of ploidy protein mob1 [Fulvia fulva]WPV23717.1 putative maintenance of ploidy protein mob1 [Fulvia fulva]